MNIRTCAAVAALALGMSAQAAEAPKTWIVVEFRTTDGEFRQVAFDHPRNPQVPLADCAAALPFLEGELHGSAVEAWPQVLTGAVLVSAECVRTTGEPF